MVTEIEKAAGNVLLKYAAMGVFSEAAGSWYRSMGEERGGSLSCVERRVEAADYGHVFDLASLTKVLVTVPSLLILLADGSLKVEEELQKFLPDLPRRWSRVRLFHLLNHSSGLPAHRPWYAWLHRLSPEERREAALEALLAESPETAPGERVCYSDLGYILLGNIIETVSGMELARFWDERVRMPLELQEELLLPEEVEEGVAVPTGLSLWNGRKLERGEVHDDNCRQLGGLCGHAGLFGTVTGVLQLSQELHRCWSGKPGLFSGSILRQLVACPEGTRRCGFDTPTGERPSCGRFFSSRTIGHLGFTGTSIWMDLEKGCGVVLLTNRVIAGEELEGIRALRRAFHDAIRSRIC